MDEPPYIVEQGDGEFGIANAKEDVPYHFYMQEQTFTLCPGIECDGDGGDVWTHVRLVKQGG